MPLRPLFLGLVAGAFGAGCSVYELPEGGGAGSEHVATGTGSGGSSSAGSASMLDDSASPFTGGGATGGSSAPDATTSGAGGEGGSADAQVSTSSDATADRMIATSDAGGPVLALPFTVDSYFRPTGYMGDGVTPGPVMVQTTGCKMPRPQGAKGNCYKITYKPQTPDAGPAWSGVYWQYPDNNWGDRPGKRIAPGATKVSFYAASETSGEMVTFRVGGIQNVGATHQDSLKVDLAEALTTTLTQYSVDIRNETYDEVLGPFAWVITTYDPAKWAVGAAPIVFYLDDIQWE
jgi:hypothetical protein